MGLPKPIHKKNHENKEDFIYKYKIRRTAEDLQRAVSIADVDGIKSILAWISDNDKDDELFQKIFEHVDKDKHQRIMQAVNYLSEKNICFDKEGRKIPARLRYEVLRRDNFRCKICGRSPKDNENIKLHIDHIKPFSEGGESTEENLQTLCEDCNLGKSNRP